VAAGNIDLNVVLRGKSQLDSANRSLGELAKKTQQAQSSSMSLGRAAKFAATALAAVGAAQIIRGTLNAIRTFEDLKATLVTIQGDANRAAQAFDMIAKFTATTTFQLDEVSNGFITLRNAGLNPTVLMMEELGNIAAGMGKRFDDVARAVFNATTGEFEMLKQLGIKVKTEGENITATFRGTSVTMKKDADSIVNYLRSIGKEDFAGAIEARSKTLTGSLSNMGDALGVLAMKLGEAGLTRALTQATKDLTTFIDRNQELVQTLGKGLGDAVTFTTKNIEGLTFAVTALFAVFGKSPVGRIVSALTAAGILIGKTYDEIVNGIDKLQKTYDKFTGKAPQTIRVFYDFDETAKQVNQTLKDGSVAYDSYNEKQAETNRLAYETKIAKEQEQKAIKDLKKQLEDAYYEAQRLEASFEQNALYAALKQVTDQGTMLEMKTAVLADGFRVFSQTASSEITDVILEAKTLDEALGNIAKATLRALIQGFINLGIVIFILEPLEKWIRRQIDSQKKLNRELKTEIALRTVLAFFGGGGGGIPFFANGGRTPANQPIIVGERGPELFVPGTAGEVIPNNELGVGSGMSGGGGDEINVTFNINTIDATDFDTLLTTRQDLIIGLINRGLAERGRRSLTA
jgi:NifU-like protein involved in Fe-S cluster formation